MSMKKGKIIIVNQKKFAWQKRNLRRSGVNNLQVICDFDRTITKCFNDGKRTASLIGILREKNYLGDDYVKKSKELFNYYHPIEIDSKISLAEKKKKMTQWWKEHFSLLISSGLTKDIVEKAMTEAESHLRPGGKEFFSILDEKKVPLLIFSAGGLGQESIRIFLRKRGLLYEKTYIVANYFIWDKFGKLVAIQEPIIHVYNKDEAILDKFPFYDEVKKRKNVIVIGDSLGDAKMAKGMPHDEVLKIGFLNEDCNSHLNPYRKAFDVLILGDSSFYFINQLLKYIFRY